MCELEDGAAARATVIQQYSARGCRSVEVASPVHRQPRVRSSPVGAACKVVHDAESLPLCGLHRNHSYRENHYPRDC